MLNLKFKTRLELERKIRIVLEDFFPEQNIVSFDDGFLGMSLEDEDKQLLTEALADSLERGNNES